jgi:hypothetical protein
MPEESRSADVEKLLADEKAIEDRKQALVADLLKQKEAAIKDFDDKLAKLGYSGNSKHRRSHHKKSGQGPAESSTPASKGKPKV